jgi:hypothetical protein
MLVRYPMLSPSPTYSVTLSRDSRESHFFTGAVTGNWALLCLITRISHFIILQHLEYKSPEMLLHIATQKNPFSRSHEAF